MSAGERKVKNEVRSDRSILSHTFTDDSREVPPKLLSQAQLLVSSHGKLLGYALLLEIVTDRSQLLYRPTGCCKNPFATPKLLYQRRSVQRQFKKPDYVQRHFRNLSSYRSN